MVLFLRKWSKNITVEIKPMLSMTQIVKLHWDRRWWHLWWCSAVRLSDQNGNICCAVRSVLGYFELGEWSWSDQQWGFIHWFVLFWSHSLHLSSPSPVAASVQTNVSDQNRQQGNGNSISHVTCCSLECNALEWREEEDKLIPSSPNVRHLMINFILQ